MLKRSNKKQRFLRILCLLMAAVLVFCGLTVYVDIRLRSVAFDFAESRMSSLLTSSVNKAASELLEDYSVTYDQICIVTRDENQKVTSVEIDTTYINRLKSDITQAVLTELKGYGSVGFSVPISAAFGIYYSFFKYPKVNYNMTVATVVFSDIKSEFYEAGINQTVHRISVTVGTRGSLAVPGKNPDIVQTTDFVLAQTVIVGDVPDAYTKIEYANEDIVDDIFDYGAQSSK